jgi:hypothetical protein
MSKSPEQSVTCQSIPAKMREKHDAIAKLIDPFCREHLNEEYLGLCLRLVGVLARKRPSPIVNGTAAAWACGIVRTIGWVNFLDDKTQQPHLKMTEVDRTFAVSSGTGQAKSKSIRDLLKMRAFDPEWTLPSRMDQNPIVWLIQVNGLLVDARHMPREVQEEAFKRGMIPYLPGEKDGDEDRKKSGGPLSPRT